MKKIILISSGIFIILLVVGVWVYLLMNGKPSNTQEVFTQLGFGGGDEVEVVQNERTQDVTNDQTGLVDTTPVRLRQLTTQPVAGAGFTDTGIRYVEQGTGHIYEINFEDGREELISGTTITQAYEAFFSPTTKTIAITSLDIDGTKTSVGEIVDGGFVFNLLPDNANNLSFNGSENIHYLVNVDGGSSGHTYNYQDSKSSRVFISPFRDIRVLWGDEVYIYTTPERFTEGYVYKISDNNYHSFVTEGGYGLTSILFEYGVVVSKYKDEEILSTAFGSEGVSVEQSLPFIPEKCVVNPNSGVYMFCAVPKNIYDGYVDDWYRGTLSYDDRLWVMDIETGKSIASIDFLKESGREMDVSRIGINDDGLKLYFINKNDNTLWLYDRTVQ